MTPYLSHAWPILLLVGENIFKLYIRDLCEKKHFLLDSEILDWRTKRWKWNLHDLRMIKKNNCNIGKIWYLYISILCLWIEKKRKRKERENIRNEKQASTSSLFFKPNLCPLRNVSSQGYIYLVYTKVVNFVISIILDLQLNTLIDTILINYDIYLYNFFPAL